MNHNFQQEQHKTMDCDSTQKTSCDKILFAWLHTPT